MHPWQALILLIRQLSVYTGGGQIQDIVPTKKYVEKYTTLYYTYNHNLRKYCTCRLTDSALVKTVEEIKKGLVEANLGGNLYKKRIATSTKGRLFSLSMDLEKAKKKIYQIKMKKI